MGAPVADVAEQVLGGAGDSAISDSSGDEEAFMVTMMVCLILLCLLLCCCACGWYLLCVSVSRKKAEDKEKPALVSVASEHTEVKLDIPDNEERWSLIALDKLAKVSGSFNLGASPRSKPAPPPDRRKTKDVPGTPTIRE